MAGSIRKRRWRLGEWLIGVALVVLSGPGQITVAVVARARRVRCWTALGARGAATGGKRRYPGALAAPHEAAVLAARSTSDPRGGGSGRSV
jgi:hypothetical protein